MGIKIVEPPVAAIDWWNFGEDVRRHWATPVLLHKQLGGGKVTAYNAHGHARVGVLPFLRICKMMQVNPFSYLMER